MHYLLKYNELLWNYYIVLGVIVLAVSMTGFGRGTFISEAVEVTAEIRAVNHRYFEFSARMPRSCTFLEDKLKALCNSRISRGKTELFVSLDTKNSATSEIAINDDFITAYLAAAKSVSKKYRVKNDVTVALLLQTGDAFTLKKNVLDEQTLEAAIIPAVNSAVDAFIEMRKNEGERLSEDLKAKTDLILENVAFIEERSPETVSVYRLKLEQKIKEVLENTEIDEQRILTEAAIFADKVAVDEETVRLRSHIKQFCDMLSSSQPAGRKLDFIVQEMNRETNTIGSKAQDTEILNRVVEMKALIEKIREQVQNIE